MGSFIPGIVRRRLREEEVMRIQRLMLCAAMLLARTSTPTEADTLHTPPKR